MVFSEQVNDPVWMAKKPFEFAAPLKGLIADDLLSKWPAPSTAQCTVNGTQYCVQDNLAQVVLWVNKKLMDKFGYTVPKTWQEWAALGQKVAGSIPATSSGTSGTRSATGSTCGATSARSSSSRRASSSSTPGMRTARGWPACWIR